MLTAPTEILKVLQPFAAVFFQDRVFQKGILLFIGSLLCNGGVTVCAILRNIGLINDNSFCRFHRFLNQNRLDMLLASKILSKMILKTFPSSVLIVSIDDTIERRRGKEIKARGIFKDPVGTGSGQTVTCSGLRWTVVTMLVRVPFMKRTVSLPFLTIPSPSERVSIKNGWRHKSPQRSSEQVAHVLRRWFREQDIIFVADAGYATVRLFKVCSKLKINLVTRARSNLRLFKPAPARTKKRGRPRTKGERLPLKELQKDKNLNWVQMIVESYGNSNETKCVTTYDCLWDSAEGGLAEVRLVFVKDLKDGPDDPAFCLITQAPLLPIEKIIETYAMRWSQEVTHRETREHLGVETQRQWSDLAIKRTTPLLFGIYSLVFLIGHQLYEQGNVSPMQTSWYRKQEPAFADLLTSVRALIRKHQLVKIWSKHQALRNIQCPSELFSILESMGVAA